MSIGSTLPPLTDTDDEEIVNKLLGFELQDEQIDMSNSAQEEAPQLATAAIRSKPYPIRNSKDAPKFEGHSTPLHRFLEDIEELCADRGEKSDAVKVKKALWYVDYKFQDSWKDILDDTKTWEQNKTTLLESFPGLDSLYKYSVNDMTRLVKKYSSLAMDSQEELAEYHCEFVIIANYLEKEKLTSRDDLNRSYVMGLPSFFRAKVLAQLTAEDPRRKPGIFHDYLQVNRAARYVLQDNAYSDRFGLDIKPVNRVTFKTEDSESPIVALMKAQKEMATELANMTKVFMQSQQSGYRNQNYSSQQNQNNSTSQYPQSSCNFCGEQGHMVRSCPTSKQMLLDGKCIINKDNRIVMPDGSWLSPPGLLKHRIERQYALANQERDIPPHLKTATLMFTCDTTDTLFNTESGLEEVGEEDVCDVLQLNTRSTGSRKPGPGQSSGNFEGPKKIPEVVISRAPLTDITNIPRPNQPQEPPTPPNKGGNKPVTMPTRYEAAAKVLPQFKFTSNAEDNELLKAVIGRSLDAEITITQRELLAVSGELRKYFKEVTTPRRIPTVNYVKGEHEEDESTYVLQFTESGKTENIVLTASPIMRLRVITATLNGEIDIECVLDQGSEIICMDKSIWRKITHSINPTVTMSMESANSQSNSTYGICENLRFTIGGMDLWFQVHVVENAPFQVLMGRPFFVYTQCITQDYSNGDQEITIVCPNTNRTAKLPTKPRKKESGKTKAEDPVFVQSRQD